MGGFCCSLDADTLGGVGQLWTVVDGVSSMRLRAFVSMLLPLISYEQLTQIPEMFDVVKTVFFGCGSLNAGLLLSSIPDS